jgi:phosphate transport system protein
VRAFGDADEGLARETIGSSVQVEATLEKIFEDLVAQGDANNTPTKDLFAVLLGVNRMGRLAAQAKNICEETIFRLSGETKAPKVYRVLFIDERNDSLSQIAEAYARKVFPNSGHYDSAGWNPASELDASCVDFMDRHGLSHPEATPEALSAQHGSLRSYHAIVSLGPDGRSHIPELPFHTTLVQWSVDDDAGLEEAFKSINVRIRELIHTLRGEEAD